jgi:quinoprotein glucose dehydrogenase
MGRIGFAVLLTLAAAPARCFAQNDWPVYGHDAGGMRYSPLDQINAKNVTRLVRAWTYHTGELPVGPEARGQRQAAFETTPLVVGGILYFSTPANRVIALNPETGHQIWEFNPFAGHSGPQQSRAHRGVAYWPGDRTTGPRIVFGTRDGRLVALNARTGKPAPGFGNEGEVNLRTGVADGYPNSIYAVTSPPLVAEGLIVTGAEVPEGPGRGPAGDIRAWDAQSGKLRWIFHTVPRPGEPGHETWEGESSKNRTGANVWTLMTADVERHMVFLAIGSPSYDFYGGDRKGANLFGDSLVALDLRTGKAIWHFQFVHHDLWDYDPPAPPALVTVNRNGRAIPAVVQVTKMGLMFVFNRVDGKPVFPVQEQPAPQSDVPGEATWPTSPFRRSLRPCRAAA